MRCPACDDYILIEDFQDDTAFECSGCKTLLKLDTDEGTYFGATDTTLIIMEDEE